MIGPRERTMLVERVLASSRLQQLKGRIKKYRCPVETEDLEAELNVGIVEALRSVKMNVGDPMEFLLSRGHRHVQSVVSAALNHGILEECLVCGKERPYRRNPCYTCGSKNFLIHPRYVPLLVDDDGAEVLPEVSGRRTKSKVQG